MNAFAIESEMQETIDVIRSFDPRAVAPFAPRHERIVIAGEGSSRLFPARNAIAWALRHGVDRTVLTEGALQAREYALDGRHLFVSSNSGRTAEGVALIRSVLDQRRSAAETPITAVVSDGDSPIAREADDAFVLRCGAERAVAATKSVVEQALFFRTLLAGTAEGGAADAPFPALAHAFGRALQAPLPDGLVDRCNGAVSIAFAGRNDGVAEELALKANEIARTRSAFFEGTYAVHGVEEVLTDRDVIIVVEPFADQEAKFSEVLSDGVGAAVFAIATRQTSFPTIVVDEVPGWTEFILLAAGWNVLLNVGKARGIDLDNPERARKVGNEVAE